MKIKKAMILAAGLGTRLGDITSNKPKSLVEVGGVPMLHRLLIHLREEGFKQVCINVHHLANQITESIRRQNNFGLDICFSDETDQLLDTGGALWAAKRFFTGEEPILIHNADILSNIDLNSFTQFHLKNHAQASLFVSKRISSRALLFNNQNQLAGWANLAKEEYKWVDGQITDYTPLSFNGVWITNPFFIQQMPFTGKFSIIDAWLTMAKEYNVLGYMDDSPWFDLGTPEKIAAAEKYLKQ